MIELRYEDSETGLVIETTDAANDDDNTRRQAGFSYRRSTAQWVFRPLASQSSTEPGGILLLGRREPTTIAW